MSFLDWVILLGSLVGVTAYGIWKSRGGARDMEGYLLAGKSMRWYTIGLSIMATQASAITFLSAPGLAYKDGMQFIQIYLGVPLAMVLICIVAIPFYYRLRVYTAYEFLEQRFDLKNRALTSFLFLIQRGLASGLTIYAPAIILSIILDWNIVYTNIVIGGIVIIYTVSGGTKAVSYTQMLQMGVIMTGMVLALLTIISLLPSDISIVDAVKVSGKMNRLNPIDLTFDLNDKYNIWSGLLGGVFLSLSYFGTDQSQVQRYLGGRSIAQSRTGLLLNAFVKIPMQAFILFIGVMLFVFYQFEKPPVYFNSFEVQKVMESPYANRYTELQQEFDQNYEIKNEKIRALSEAMRSDDQAAIDAAQQEAGQVQSNIDEIRSEVSGIVQTVAKEQNFPSSGKDSNYVFLSFVTKYFPPGLIGLIIAAIFAASMSSTSSELNALASTTIVDIYKRIIKKNETDRHYVLMSKLITVGWGIFAIAVAILAGKMGNLIEVVNILGSLFYGTILGIFVLAFFFRWIKPTAAFISVIIAELAVIALHISETVAYLWYNLIGCVLVIILAITFHYLLPARKKETT